MTTRVLMLGPSFDSRGGMATFAETALKAWETIGPCDVKLGYHPTVVPGSRPRKLLYGLSSFYGFSRELKCADIVHINFALGASLQRKAVFARKAKRSGKRVILHSHSSALEVAIRAKDAAVLKGVVPFLEMSDAVIVLADYWRKLLVSIGIDARHIHVVSNGVEVPETWGSSPDNPTGPVRCLYLGRLEPEKGLDELLIAASGAIAKGASLSLVLAGVGEDAYVSALRERADSLGLDVRFPGWVEGEGKLALIRSSDVFLLPSHREVLPMSLLESMAGGLAPVATGVGAVPEVVDNGVNGLLCEVGDSDSLSDALVRMCGDMMLRQRCSKNARRTVEERYSVESMVQGLSTVYREVLSCGQ